MYASQQLAAEVNDRGNFVYRGEQADQLLGFVNGGTAPYARRLAQQGYQAWKTLHDSWHFGVWVNVSTLSIVTYSNFEAAVVQCTTPDSFQEEILDMALFYGEPTLDFSEVNPNATRARRQVRAFEVMA